jgi:predicted metal-dependent peptidase
MGELKAMLQAFPHVSARLYYADSELHGPYEVEDYEEVPVPRGGGGTDFQPFFTHVAQDAGGPAHQVLVYLTDGYGRFPDKEPTVETVWVVTPGGLQEDGFPFGRTIKLASQ